MRPYSYNSRLESARLFVTAITKTSRTRLTPIRVKQLCKIEDIPSLLSNKLDYKYVVIYIYILESPIVS